MNRRAVIFDKDGTLIENVPMNVDPARIRLTLGAEIALPRLAEAGYRVAVASNQSGIALGAFAEADLVPVEARLRELLGDLGVELDGFFYCPHHPDGVVPAYRRHCSCRKPAPGLIQRACDAMDVALSDAWVVGDILDDVEAAHRAGCRAILFDSGGETEWIDSPWRRPEFRVDRLAQAADVILEAEVREGV